MEDDNTIVDAERILSMIDLTSLGSDDTPDRIIDLCAQAVTKHGSVAAVCVWPEFVGLAVEQLAGTAVPVAGVSNFPEGEDNIERAVMESEEIIHLGGREVDVVFPWRTLKSGERGVGERLVAATRQAVGDDVVLKVILETGELGDAELIREAAEDAVAGGSDFLKTSTGKTEHGASLEAARVLFETVAAGDHPVGVKISGGVRTLDQARPYLRLAEEIMGESWATPLTLRFGASSLLDDILRVLASPRRPVVD